MTLPSLVQELRGFPGIRRKQAVGRVLRELGDAWSLGSVLEAPGDDAAVVKTDGDRFLLLAADAIMPLLTQKDPYRAGRAAVLVNVNDIYAMGGRPLALVSVIAGLGEEELGRACQGMRDECRRLRVPMAGGHVSPEGESPFLAGAILGEARALLSDRNARPGQSILLALDLRGERWGDYLLNWDSHGGKDPETVCADLAILCSLADEGLAVAAKDVSNAGILGSLGMLLENARLGAWVDLDRIRVPASFSLVDWLKVYPSYGFLVVGEESGLLHSRERFMQRGIWAEEVGRTDDTGTLRVRSAGEEAVFMDFSRESVFGKIPSPPGEG